MSVLEDPIKKVLVLKNYIDGEWEESKGELHDIINPATLKVVARAPSSTKEEVDEAVISAKEAFYEWRKTPPLSRVRCLFRLKELLEKNFEELSRIQTMEHGKTIDESRGETRRGIENVEVATGIPSLMMGENLEDIASGIDEQLIHQPLGVFSCIAPYNFPFMVPLWFAPYAVATGNCIIIKPSPRDPITQVKLAELVDEAGFTPGIWSVVQGGAEVANALLEHPGIEGACFVGSTPVARKIYQKCGQMGKKVIAQGGAKNFIVIMPDANLEKTIPGLMTAFYGNTGQRCLAGANALVVGDNTFYQHFVQKFCDAASRIKIGYGLDETVQMGPIQSKDGKNRVLSYIEEGVSEGAKLTLDGRKVDIEGSYPQDCFIGPTVFEEVTPDMRIGQEEIFGPVASIMRAKDLDEAISIIHKSPFGNAASIFTSSGRYARKFRYETRCGNIGINIGIAAPMAFFPFSGMKDSFFGILHGQGKEVIRFFTESKVVIERWW